MFVCSSLVPAGLYSTAFRTFPYGRTGKDGLSPLHNHFSWWEEHVLVNMKGIKMDVTVARHDRHCFLINTPPPT
jgi:hypothetical protein